MNLTQLFKEIQEIIERVKEDGNNPLEIDVSIQIDDCVKRESHIIEDIKILYDNYGDVSGLCIFSDEIRDSIKFDNPHGLKE